jgi:hypothetical protein
VEVESRTKGYEKNKINDLCIVEIEYKKNKTEY